MKIAVIGAGVMGQWLANFFGQNVGDVVISDIDIEKAKSAAAELKIKFRKTEEAVTNADLILVAVPISKTVEVVKSIAKIAKKGALIADIASVKEEVVEALNEIKEDVELVSIHPLFGQGAKAIKGKDLLVIPVRPGENYKMFKKEMSRLGAKITEIKADEHDKMMAIVQCLTHFTLLTYLNTLRSLKEFEKTKEIETPMFASLSNLARAVLAGNSEVYRELQTHNRYAKIIRSRLIESCKELDKIFSARDVMGANKIFEEAMGFFELSSIQKSYAEMYKNFEEGLD